MSVSERSSTEVLVESVSEVPVLPHVVFSVLEPAGPTEPTASDLIKIVARDPGMAARSLSLANGHSDGQGIASLESAMSQLGYSPVRALAMTAQVFDAFMGRSDVTSTRRRAWWQHSLDTADWARWLAIESGKVDPDEAYTAGLLHLLGKSLLDRYGGKDYESVSDMECNGTSDLEAENSVYGCSHIELLRELAIRWGYPLRLVQSLDYRSEPMAAGDRQLCRACIALASRVAEVANLGAGLRPAYLEKCPDWALDALGTTRECLRDAMGIGIEGLRQRQPT
jgi:HD-like signal output (HDOD) protein